MAGSNAQGGSSSQSNQEGAGAGSEADKGALGAGAPDANGTGAGDAKNADGQAKGALDQVAKDGKAGEAEKNAEKNAEPKPLELQLPEGFDAKDPSLDALRGLAKAEGLNQKQAQAVLDAYWKAGEQDRKAISEFQSQRTAWAEALPKDKEFGGPKYEENLRYANVAIEKLGGAQLRKAILDHGLENHPEFVRAFYRAGRAISPDSIAGTQQSSGKKDDSHKSLEERLGAALYPDMNAR